MLDTIKSFLDHNTDWIAYLAIFSVVLIVISILIIPIVVTKIPANYFVQPKRSLLSKISSPHGLLILLTRNLLGLILLAAGILMLILPGQGLLTILLAILVMDFPGKYTVERYLVEKPFVLKGLNWLRRRHNIPDLSIE